MKFPVLESINPPWVFKAQQKWTRSQWLEGISSSAGKAETVTFLEGCNNLDAFFSEMKRSLNFPDYFGRNFAALTDVLNDGDIVDCSSLCLVIVDGGSFLIDDTQDRLDGLIDTLELIGRDWSEGARWPWTFPPRPFHTVIQLENDDPRYKRVPQLEL